jgi:hypothetical protein
MIRKLYIQTYNMIRKLYSIFRLMISNFHFDLREKHNCCHSCQNEDVANLKLLNPDSHKTSEIRIRQFHLTFDIGPKGLGGKADRKKETEEHFAKIHTRSLAISQLQFCTPLRIGAHSLQ